MIFKQQYIIFFVSNVFVVLLLTFAANRAYAGDSIKVPEDFESINEAIAAAARFDTVIVPSGFYEDNLFIPNRLILLQWNKRSLSQKRISQP